MVELNGKELLHEYTEKLKQIVADRGDKRAPKLTIITIGEDESSKVYVNNKIKTAEEIGIEVDHRVYAADTKEEDIAAQIIEMNNDDTIDGILIQLPLPEGFHTEWLTSHIAAGKDVDGLTPFNAGCLRKGIPTIVPCTALGVGLLLDAYNINVKQADVVVVGRSNIAGKPIADLFLRAGATITQCHSKTKDLDDKIANADILIAAVGSPKAIKAQPKNKVIIDVGINKDEEGNLCGDVDYSALPEDGEYYITPVPGGVGPMTVAGLMVNVIEIWEKKS